MKKHDIFPINSDKGLPYFRLLILLDKSVNFFIFFLNLFYLIISILGPQRIMEFFRSVSFIGTPVYCIRYIAS